MAVIMCEIVKKFNVLLTNDIVSSEHPGTDKLLGSKLSVKFTD